jgi:hypothetical protein
MSVMKNLAPAVALSTALYSGAFEVAKQPEPYQVHPLPATYEAVITDAFVASENFWEGQGVDLDTHLQIITGDQAVVCHNQDSEHVDKAKNLSGFEYCSGDHRIVISEGYVDYMSGGYRVPERIVSAVLKLAIGHEEGHAVQQATVGLVPETERTLEYQVTIENQADCYSGKFMQAVYPDEATTASAIYEIFSPFDVAHGLPVQRYESYFEGVQTGVCEPEVPYGPFTSPLAPSHILRPIVSASR